MANFYIVPPTNDEETFALCADHTEDRRLALTEAGYFISPIATAYEECAECVEAGDPYDDGDYPGVEQDENMERIEGWDFWCPTDYGDEGY